MNDPARDACAERCAEFGDPPCWEVVADMKRELGERLGPAWSPCADCFRDIGVEVVDPIDPAAIVSPLL